MSVAHRQYFNQLAANWEQIVSHDENLQRLMVRFGISAGDRVLDLGAGTGRLAKYLVGLVGKKGMVVAEDFSEQMLLQANSVLRNGVEFTCADISNLSFKEGCFDKAVCFSTFPHLPSPKKALTEINQVLACGGKLLILHTSCSRKLNTFHAHLDGVVRNDILPRIDKLSVLFEQNGFIPLTLQENPQLYWAEAQKKVILLPNRSLL